MVSLNSATTAIISFDIKRKYLYDVMECGRVNPQLDILIHLDAAVIGRGKKTKWDIAIPKCVRCYCFSGVLISTRAQTAVGGNWCELMLVVLHSLNASQHHLMPAAAQ
jgi:hypothetical protein